MRNMLMLFAALAATGFGQTKVPDMVAIVYTDVIPARTAENEAGLAKIRDAYKKAEYPFYLNLTRLRHQCFRPPAPPSSLQTSSAPPTPPAVLPAQRSRASARYRLPDGIEIRPGLRCLSPVAAAIRAARIPS